MRQLLSNGSISYGGVSLEFGRGTPYPMARFNRGVPEMRTDDFERPRGDGSLVGQDFTGSSTFELDLVVDAGSPELTRAAVDAFAPAWDAEVLRQSQGDVAELRIGDRVAYGRPRRLEINEDGLWDGVAELFLTFFAVQGNTWFGAPGSAELSLVPPLGRGLVAPLVEPLTIQGAAQNASGFTVGGVVPTYPVITFRGPVTNPEIDAGVWHLKIRGSLAYDETLVVDTRPWKRSLSLNGRPVAGMLMPTSSRLRDCVLPPGTYSVRLRGVDATGTATASVEWREAYASF